MDKVLLKELKNKVNYLGKKKKQEQKELEAQQKAIEKKKKQEERELQKKRKTVEFNGMEYVCALLLNYEDITNLNELYKITKSSEETKIIFNNENDKEEYIKDIKNKECLVSSYINDFRKCNCIDNKNIKNIYVSGKKNKHEFIENLNKEFDVKETKSDIYIVYNDNSLKGLSVKQSYNAQKSNYSSQKMVDKYENGSSKKLSEIKREYLENNNISSFKEEERKIVNKLFYRDNPYFDALKLIIEKHKKEIAIDLFNYLNSIAVSYDVYEFDGKEMTHLNKKRDFDSISFELHEPYKYTKKGNLRNAAKLFYQLIYDDKKYRVEIRWKGNIYNSSPQFCIHND